jgi:16S rRNA (uracil1498-N3)-methyltransferase
MQRYFVSNDQRTESSVMITGEDARHMSKVMRMKPGDPILVCDEAGQTFLCDIQELQESNVLCRIKETIKETSELPIKVTLAQGLPKGDKLDLVIQKGTELGAFGFLPFESERAIVKWESSKIQKKLERLRKISKEAAEQSHRNTIPLIHEPLRLNALIEFSQTFTYKMVAYEEEAKLGEAKRFAQLLSTIKEGDSLLVVLGPEGGLTADEVDTLQQAGFILAGLGPRILRTETAPLYVLSAVSYQFELLRGD